MRLLVIDADTILFKIALRAQNDTFDVDPDFPIEFTEAEYLAMVNEARDFIKNMMFTTKCMKYRSYLTGSNNYRYNFLPSYKWRRDYTKTPSALPALKQLMLSMHSDFFMLDGEEADDSCTRDFSTVEEGVIKILAHIDKDLNQVAGEHYDYEADELYSVNQYDADTWVLYQMLCGDTADCYKGCPNVGGEIAKSSVLGSKMTKRERVYGSKAMIIAQGTLCTRPIWNVPTKGKLKGIPQLKWEEYHDKTLTDAERLLTWYIKGYVQKGGQGHKLGFDTTSGFEDDVKIYLDEMQTEISLKDLEFLKNEMNIQYNMAYMLRAGEDIPTEIRKFI